ncbi:MAG TPA: hypothetical protein VFB33_03265 [Candidatus Binataceae bacterium]|jgi:hypothetical protein|nr:hypothetical protein [Candidatus Binataceae bacterium]
MNGAWSRHAGVRLFAGSLVAYALLALAAPRAARADGEHHRRLNVQWVNHFDLLPGDPSVTSTSALSTSSGVGSGLTGLVITSSTLGDTDSFNGNKVVQMALELQQKTTIFGVHLCYELSDPGPNGSFIDQIRLAQVQDPPSTALVLLDDPTQQDASGPTCVDSALASPPIQSKNGSVLLSLRIQTGNTADKIVVRALGLLVKPQD